MKKFFKWFLITLGGVFGFILLITIISAIFASGTESEDDNSAIKDTVVVNSTDVNSKTSEEWWTYEEDIDEMTSKKMYFAYNISPVMLTFKFPYEGGSTFKLALRNSDNENHVLLICSKGQFMPSYGTGETMRVKFDDNQPFKINYTMPTDGSTNIVFLDVANTQFLSMLKRSEKLIIEATFYDEGNRQIRFNTKGLRWEH